MYEFDNGSIGNDNWSGKLSDYSLQTTSVTVSGDFEIGDHAITTSDDFHSFECERCEESFEVPEIFLKSTGFRTIVYEMYILGHFKNNTCTAKRTRDLLDKLEKRDSGGSPLPSNGNSPKPGDVYWMDTIDKPVYYSGNNGGSNMWHTPDGRSYTTDQFIDSLPPKAQDEFVALVEQTHSTATPESPVLKGLQM